jgi:hypothetical protein
VVGFGRNDDEITVAVFGARCRASVGATAFPAIGYVRQDREGMERK